MLVCWLVFNFVALVDFECCSVAQEISYVLYFCQLLITCHCWPLSLSCLCLQKVFMEISSLLLPISLVHLHTLPPLVCVPFQFLVYYWVFIFYCRTGGQSVQGALLVCPRGDCGDTAWHLFAHIMVYWMSPKQVWCCLLVAQEPSCFLSVMWHGEALYRLWVKGVKILFFVVLFLCQVWLQCLSKIFDLWSSCCMLSAI
jgi:hypothetical protein